MEMYPRVSFRGGKNGHPLLTTIISLPFITYIESYVKRFFIINVVEEVTVSAIPKRKNVIQ